MTEVAGFSMSPMAEFLMSFDTCCGYSQSAANFATEPLRQSSTTGCLGPKAAAERREMRKDRHLT